MPPDPSKTDHELLELLYAEVQELRTEIRTNTVRPWECDSRHSAGAWAADKLLYLGVSAVGWIVTILIALRALNAT